MTRSSPKLDIFAGLLAENLTVREAAEEMGVTRERGHRYLEMLCKKLGVEQCR